MKSFATRLRDDLGAVADSFVPSPGLPEQIEHRTRQRARNRTRLLTAVVASMAVATAVLVVATRGPARRTVAITPATTSTLGAVTPGPPPSQFLAVIDGSGTATAFVRGMAGSHLFYPLGTATPGAHWTIGVDGKTLYAPTRQKTGCAIGYTAIDVASGATQGPAFTGIANLNLVALSPDGQTIAYTTCGPTGGSNVFLQRKDKSVLPITAADHPFRLSWNADGTLLAFEVTGPSGVSSVQVWAVSAGAGKAVGTANVAAPTAGCGLELPRFAANGLYAIEECPFSTNGPTTIRLLLLDPTTGHEQRSWLLATEPQGALIADLAIDPQGRWALYAISSKSMSGLESLLSLTQPGAQPQTLLTDAEQLAWLPNGVAGTGTGTGITITTPPPTRAPGRPPTTVAPTRQTTIPLSTVQTTIPTDPSTTPTSRYLPSCTSGAPTTPVFIFGCIRPDGTIQPPPGG